uniref:Uncharacterized protein n=1 Tax=Periophthalmus magnuspinnatus TaxID=409849 RepID=A0A3B4AXE5_9GOBI
MRLLLLGLLLVGSCCLSRAGLILENGAPIMWAHATSQPTDLTITEGVLTPDPWHYLHRMSFYRILIAATDPYMTSMGPGDNQSPIWGLPLQLGWMLTSGRLADPTGLTVCGTQGGDTADMCISTNSWWGCVNYFSSALPFLSAAKQGILGDGLCPVLAQVQMQSPAGVEGYCTTYDSCKTAHPDVINNWDSFFQVRREIPTFLKIKLILRQWRSESRTDCKEETECDAKASAQMKLIEAGAGGEADLDHSIMFGILTVSVIATKEPIRSEAVEGNAPSLPYHWFNRERAIRGTLASMWRRAMCSVTTRENGREMLKQLLFNPEYATSSFLSIVTSMSTSCGS